jgi:hypothetical protein
MLFTSESGEFTEGDTLTAIFSQFEPKDNLYNVPTTKFGPIDMTVQDILHALHDESMSTSPELFAVLQLPLSEFKYTFRDDVVITGKIDDKTCLATFFHENEPKILFSGTAKTSSHSADGFLVRPGGLGGLVIYETQLNTNNVDLTKIKLSTIAQAQEKYNELTASKRLRKDLFLSIGHESL